jgi:hypothetical protein
VGGYAITVTTNATTNASSAYIQGRGGGLRVGGGGGGRPSTHIKRVNK